MLDSIRKIDGFPKAFDDFRIKTHTGAIISILSGVLMIVLFCSELSYMYKLETVDHLYVNTTRTQKLTIDFDISFLEIPCNILAIDAYDDIGNQQKESVHDIYKHKINSAGETIGEAEKLMELGHTLESETQLEIMAAANAAKTAQIVKEKISDCGNCYGAGYTGQCCNTCQEVKDAYERMGWHLRPQTVIQCASEEVRINLQDQYAEDGGCRIYGSVSLDKTSGRFHIAPHKKLHQGTGAHMGLFNLMDLISFTFDQFNVSHIIHGLSFGDMFPGIKSPLDGQKRIIEDTHGMYQYFIKVVPTRYKFHPINRRQNTPDEIQSNQYSVTEHMSHLAPGSGRGLPGLYFNYEVSPIHANFEEKKRTNWLNFVTSACAYCCGVFTVMGLIDGIISACFNVFNRDIL